MIASIHGAHSDEQAWSEPELFKPERFIDESGHFSPKLDKSLPFGAGKRVCAGETFARNTLFLIVSALVQHFNIEMPKNMKMPLQCDMRTGVIQYLPEYRLKFVSR